MSSQKNIEGTENSKNNGEKDLEDSKDKDTDNFDNISSLNLSAKGESTTQQDSFKKPILFPKPEHILSSKAVPQKDTHINDSTSKLSEKNFDYKEPLGACLPKTTGKNYSFEVLKNGSIVETIDLMKQRFWVFGRQESCHIVMQHPTISRIHAVLQYLGDGNEIGDCGFYLYDMNSTHGTFLNKMRVKPKSYVRIQVGHMLKLGCSTRNFLLNGPEEDQEAESELSVAELKQKRAEEMAKLKEAEEKEREKEEARGIDWGLGEDADEEVDLSENPYAQTNNEDLFIDDPKKALRGFFEREGLDLQYNCSEHGMGHFLCKVELPLDDENGKPIIAEVLHKGKKKEAVLQCALEACKILDRHGVLRQASHESRKRKAKNWEENDYYDSDEDTFLDRTGTIEKKREKRMNANVSQKVETYDSLCEQEKNISRQIEELEKKLDQINPKHGEESKEAREEDSLDEYMNQLSDSRPDKISINRIKTDIAKLKVELVRVKKLISIVKPTTLPSLVTGESSIDPNKKKLVLPMIGKRKTGKVILPAKPATQQILLGVDDGIEEDESEEEIEKANSKENKSGF